MQYMKQFIILFFCSSLIFAQQETPALFSTTEPLDVKLAFSPKKLKKSKVDTLYFDAQMDYKQPGEDWNSIKIGIRARGNFRRSTCYYPPIKVEIKKEQRKGTIFKGQKKLKLVLPCLQQKDKNDNILKELMIYKMYALINPYHFRTRRVALEFTDLSKKKPVTSQLVGFLIEDDKNVAKTHEGKVFERFIHPLAMDSQSSIKNALFQYMVGNTDFSVAYQHNGKLLYIGKKIVPLPYDFDMTGFINPSYAVVNPTLKITKITDRQYRGFKRDEADFMAVRQLFLDKKEEMLAIMKGYESDFDDPKEFNEAYAYIESFYDVIEDEASFMKNVVTQARTK